MDIPSIIIFSGSLGFSDYLRGKLFTGFPWNSWAYSASWSVEFLQILNFIGLYAFNLLIITLFIFPAVVFFNTSTTKKFFYFIFTFSIILSLYIYGNYEINKNTRILDNINEKIYVKIVSPNFKLEYDLQQTEIEERLNKLIRYSNPDKNKKTLFIWPEGVFSGYSYQEVQILKKGFQIVFLKKHLIVFGINNLDELSGDFYNSMLVVDNNFKIIHRYDKRKLCHLVNFYHLKIF